jgi:hypothetical protein
MNYETFFHMEPIGVMSREKEVTWVATMEMPRRARTRMQISLAIVIITSQAQNRERERGREREIWLKLAWECGA